MARTPKPWFWKERKSWYVTIRGERKNLGADKNTALQAFHEMMSKPPKTPLLRGDLVVSVIDQFLDATEKHSAVSTYAWYQLRLQLFARRYPDLFLDELKPFHVQQWIDSYPNVSSGTRRNYARSIIRCMNWAEQQGLIERSPLAHFQKPKGGVRQNVITPEEYSEILDSIPREAFRDLVTFAWETGARAAECLAIERRHLDLAGHRIVFPVEEEKMQRMPRIIYLTDMAEEIVRRLAVRHPQGTIFCNANGSPWTTASVNCAFVALQVRMGLRMLKHEGFVISEEEIQAKIAMLRQNRCVKRRTIKKSPAVLRAEARRKLRAAAASRRVKKHCLTEFRHSYCHRLLKAGVDALTVSVLMGHSDPTMIAKVYSHLSHAPDYLRDILRKPR